ncbi:protein ImuB [Roseimicrobium gellanilyticum]|uniref:Protein ImuB n=1 Tax=Roseimicrobium gellanilyticum TaxID=748857 RepID=A0A366HQE0_9BACT|nr:DNA polymerase Y family protein [Roseimicrobium gellanilyticum]RBP45008.1 protein ImuB [Roseimicrobium gellanilyticum]
MSVSHTSIYAALWLPRFQLQAALRAWPDTPRVPLAVLDSDLTQSPAEAEKKGHVLHANPQAERAGITAGMTPSQALARCHGLILRHRHPEEEMRAHADLLRCASHWTPHYESTAPGLCVMEVSRVRNMRGRLEASGANMRQWLVQCGLQAQVGFAGNLDMACLAARAAKDVLVLQEHEGCERTLLHQLPLAVLQPSANVTEVLQLWGIRTLAELIKLPRADITARLGMEGATLWDMAAGGRERLLRLVRPEVAYREVMELEHPVESLEPLLFLLRRMLDSICGRLAEVWLVASEERLTLRFENDEVHERSIQLAEPSRHAGLLLRVLHTHLDGLTTASPIRVVILELTASAPDARQSQLFQRGLRNPNRFAETLAQLEALLGAGNVGRPVLLPSRRPGAFALKNQVEALAVTSGVLSKDDTPSPEEGIAHGLPLRWRRPPCQIRVQMHEGRPAAMNIPEGWLEIVQANPCSLLSGDWWDCHAWQREIWEVAASDGALYQIAREKQGWMLDGMFG